MFGASGHVEKEAVPPPAGVAEFIFCVFDEKHKLRHHFSAGPADPAGQDFFRILNDPKIAIGNGLLHEAFETHQSTSVTLSYGDDQRKFLYVLPYKYKREKWHFACVQMVLAVSDPDAPEASGLCALAGERTCLLLADAHHLIRSVSPRVPQAFGYTSGNLSGMNLSDLFSEADLHLISSCSPDGNESIPRCVFQCVDGSRRDVEIRKFSAADGIVLYAVCDVSPPKFNEEFSVATARERRRIGQDLHDSIGQLMTGISLLSRSLANSLTREDNPGAHDASQISELADEASDQIRQISRGLMPSEIVQHGLHESLRELARTTTASCRVESVALIEEAVSVSDGAVETHLYRIAQEAVNNAVRHAEASCIEIKVSAENGNLQLVVSDNGTWKRPGANLNGIGLKTMEYRASAIGGQFKVGTHEEGGTRVICRLETEESFHNKDVIHGNG